MKTIVEQSRRARRAVWVAVCLVACASGGCGMRNFLQVFPVDCRLENQSETQFLRAATFTFDPAQDSNTGNRAGTGRVVATFGDATESFDVPGRVTATHLLDKVQPVATLTIVYEPTEEDRAKYRALVGRWEDEEDADDPAPGPMELPTRQTFQAQIFPEAKTVILTDDAGSKVILQGVRPQ